MTRARGLALAAGLLIALPGLFVGAVFAASELGGEVVVLVTRDAEDAAHRTHLWVVEDAGRLWLRAGDPGSGWLQRLEARPGVGLEREGRAAAFRATPVPMRRDRVNELMAEKYGWADRLIGLLRAADGVVPVRLDPEAP